MTFIRFLFYKIYSFYKWYQPNDDDPEIYAFGATVLVLGMNLISLHFGFILLTNPKQDVNVYWGLVDMGVIALLCYGIILKGGKYKQLASSSFNLKLFKGWAGSVFVVCYIIASFVVVILLAHAGRQYRMG